MPLLRRQPFEKEPLPEELQQHEELFYCKLTKEVFRDYDAFFERVILCNSLVWTCELTGRPGLTYLEAVESEEKARTSLAAMPAALKRALLFTARYSKRGRLSDLCDDVFYYVKDRFFVGEEVEAVVDGKRQICRIEKVVAPGKRRTPSASGQSNGGHDDAEAEAGRLEVDPNSFKYQVRVCGGDGKAESATHLLTADDVMRKKGIYSREKNKLLLKHACALHDGRWIVKNKCLKKYRLEDVKLKDMFAGPKPNLEALTNNRRKQNAAGSAPSNGAPSKSKGKDGEGADVGGDKKKVEGKPPAKKKNGDKGEEKPVKVEAAKRAGGGGKPGKDKDGGAAKEEKPTVEDRKKAKEELKQKLDEEKRKRKVEKEKEREKLREERRIMAECLREWQKPRDDLECDDLMDLPPTVPVQCGIPNDTFGDALVVLEFVHTFYDLLAAKDRFPQGLTLELLNRALVERDHRGPLNDLLQLLIRNVFAFRDDGDDEEADAGEKAEDEERSNKKAADGEKANDAEGCTTEDSKRASPVVPSRPDRYHCMPLRKVTLDEFTLTELLRLHFLESASRCSPAEGLNGDPVSQLCVQHPELIAALGRKTVFDLSPGEKLRVLQTLVNQLLSFVALREEVEDRLEKLRVAKQDLKQHQWARQRTEKEEAARRFKHRMEERAKADAASHPVSPSKPSDAKSEVAKGGDKKVPLDAKSTAVVAATPEKVPLEKLPTGKSPEKLPTGKSPEKLPTDKSPEKLPTKEARLASKRAKQKLEFLKKEAELSEAVARLQNRGVLCPLGRDRAYRRFWMVAALPGLFVEDDDDHVGACLPQPTPHNPHSNPYMSFNRSITMARHQAQRNAGDKENSEARGKQPGLVNGAAAATAASVNPKVQKSHKLLSDNHPTVNGLLDDARLEPESATERKSAIFGMCNAGGDSCLVHGSAHKSVKWSFYPTAAQVELLIASLNPRGYREGSLKEILVAEKRKVVQSVGKCPVSILNPAIGQEEACAADQNEAGGKSVHPTTSLPSEGATAAATSLADLFELTFRDAVLDLEDKIHAGGLGSIKVKDRLAWREALQQRTYDRQCETLSWSTKDGGKVVINGVCRDGTKPERGNERQVAKDEPANVATVSTAATESVFNLTCALLQVYQGIEARYLQSPLALEGDESDAARSQLKLLLERWEESLMSSTSLPQLFIHLATLEKSVAWSKSILNARCRLCRRKGDAERMLLCDGCNRGHHIYCLKPPLKEIPDGEWMCSDCRPIKSPARRGRKRREVVEENGEDDGQQQPRRRALEADRESPGGVAEPPVARTKPRSEEHRAENATSCNACKGSAGHLIRCCRCKYSYHCECVEPPLPKIPRGKWVCLKCFIHSPPKRRLKKRRQDKDGGGQGPRGPKRRKKEEAVSPRRSERNVGRRVHYDKHSVYLDDDNWNGKRLRKSSRLLQEAMSDEEYYRLTRRNVPPVRRGASDDVPLDYKVCDELLTELVRHKDCWPFLRPVGKREMPTYRDIVKRPMDFGTMRSKLNAMVYQNNKEFVADVLLIFQNCCVFNPVNSVEYRCAERLGRLFQQRLTELRLKLVLPAEESRNGDDGQPRQTAASPGRPTAASDGGSNGDCGATNEEDEGVEVDERIPGREDDEGVVGSAELGDDNEEEVEEWGEELELDDEVEIGEEADEEPSGEVEEADEESEDTDDEFGEVDDEIGEVDDEIGEVDDDSDEEEEEEEEEEEDEEEESDDSDDLSIIEEDEELSEDDDEVVDCNGGISDAAKTEKAVGPKKETADVPEKETEVVAKKETANVVKKETAVAAKRERAAKKETVVATETTEIVVAASKETAAQVTCNGFHETPPSTIP